MSSLACKCVFYRPEHNAKGEAHGIEFLEAVDQRCSVKKMFL